VNIAFMPGRSKNGTVYNFNNGTQINEETNYDYDTGMRISIMVGFNMSK